MFVFRLWISAEMADFATRCLSGAPSRENRKRCREAVYMMNSAGRLRMFEERRGVTESCGIIIVKRGHLAMFSPLEGQTWGHQGGRIQILGPCLLNIPESVFWLLDDHILNKTHVFWIGNKLNNQCAAQPGWRPILLTIWRGSEWDYTTFFIFVELY